MNFLCRLVIITINNDGRVECQQFTDNQERFRQHLQNCEAPAFADRKVSSPNVGRQTYYNSRRNRYHSHHGRSLYYRRGSLHNQFNQRDYVNFPRREHSREGYYDNYMTPENYRYYPNQSYDIPRQDYFNNLPPQNSYFNRYHTSRQGVPTYLPSNYTPFHEDYGNYFNPRHMSREDDRRFFPTRETDFRERRSREDPQNRSFISRQDGGFREGVSVESSRSVTPVENNPQNQTYAPGRNDRAGVPIGNIGSNRNSIKPHGSSHHTKYSSEENPQSQSQVSGKTGLPTGKTGSNKNSIKPNGSSYHTKDSSAGNPQNQSQMSGKNDRVGRGNTGSNINSIKPHGSSHPTKDSSVKNPNVSGKDNRAHPPTGKTTSNTNSIKPHESSRHTKYPNPFAKTGLKPKLYKTKPANPALKGVNRTPETPVQEQPQIKTEANVTSVNEEADVNCNVKIEMCVTPDVKKEAKIISDDFYIKQEAKTDPKDIE